MVQIDFQIDSYVPIGSSRTAIPAGSGWLDGLGRHVLEGQPFEADYCSPDEVDGMQVRDADRRPSQRRCGAEAWDDNRYRYICRVLFCCTFEGMDLPVCRDAIEPGS